MCCVLIWVRVIRKIREEVSNEEILQLYRRQLSLDSCARYIYNLPLRLIVVTRLRRHSASFVILYSKFLTLRWWRIYQYRVVLLYFMSLFTGGNSCCTTILRSYKKNRTVILKYIEKRIPGKIPGEGG